jgi:ADP-ribosyl-[dinitrogen reductase] hydrolase
MDFTDRLKGCLIYGAIGDSIGGRYEGTTTNDVVDFSFEWSISDDTQLTLATCEAIFDSENVRPDKVAQKFLDWYNRRKLTGLGSSTLKALRELQMGGHWAYVGRSGEYAAGNGAAMRIAPLAFKRKINRQTIKDVCSITHKNDEAYTGALAIYYSIVRATNNDWLGGTNLIEKIIGELPDTNVKDRLLEFEKLKNLTIDEIGLRYKPTGYVVDSVPISIFAAQKISQLSFQEIVTELIKIGGDTDTTCSMAGQIIGSLIGGRAVPGEWVDKFRRLGIHESIDNLVANWKE